MIRPLTGSAEKTTTKPDTFSLSPHVTRFPFNMDWNGPAANSVLFINHERFLVKDLLDPVSSADRFPGLNCC
ncbi:MAG: hypothetical protein B6I30_10545 [Desulfobacteraceae bacterium 4572_187]|nr:MAG: hypothetical protein B6I30_10545 [Desulfobacteraceae bacterium 4572_187]